VNEEFLGRDEIDCFVFLFFDLFCEWKSFGFDA